MASLTICRGSRKTVCEAEAGTCLADILRDSGDAPAMPCGGNGKCGKCRVLASGNLSAPDDNERTLLGDAPEGTRLACMTRITGDAEVTVGGDEIDTLSWAEMPEVKPDGRGFGAAVDIGTTTVAVRLYDCTDGRPAAEELAGNSQAPYGADVISRIGRADNGDHTAITGAIRSQLTEMADKCMKKAGVSELTKAVVTGNTTMLHFYEGLDSHGIAVAPFTAASLFGCRSAYRLCDTDTYLPPCIGAYIGADIVCAVMASGMANHPEKTSLLADIGTNGEVVLMHDGKLICCSTAAGPAFEGAGLRMGMRASAGAVTGIALLPNGSADVTVMGDCDASGICGSGAIDAIRAMMESGAIDGSGRIPDTCPGPGEIVVEDGLPSWRIPGTHVSVTQKDVRQIQLAKSAICAGIRTLLDYAGVRPEDVSSFYIAGGFGHSMNAGSAAAIGLFPGELLDVVHVIGNGALAGASMLLLSGEYTAEAERIRSLAEEIELSGNQKFMDLYVDGMFFGEGD